MAESKYAIEFILKNEGGFTDNVNDSGGATNFGLSLRFLRQIPVERLRKYGIVTPSEMLGVEDVKRLDVGEAYDVYLGEFWNENYAKFRDQLIANYVFDMAVLHGASQAVKLLQRALWAVRAQKDFVLDDGVLGEKTLDAVNLLSTSFIPLQASLQSALMAERAGFCRLLCEINPKNKEFLDGWLERCYRI